MEVKINNNTYNLKEAKTDQEKEHGLQGISKLPKNEGMIFYFDPPQKVSFWMHDTSLYLDVIFVNDDLEVIKVSQGKPNDDTPMECDDVAYVIELNADSGIKIGDEIEFPEEKLPVMKVLAPDGSTQLELWSGERIFSRRNTKVLIKKAKKADASKDDKDYRTLGRFMFKCIKQQNEREPEYVQAPEDKNQN